MVLEYRRIHNTFAIEQLEGLEEAKPLAEVGRTLAEQLC